jgi:hypothetical protein
LPLSPPQGFPSLPRLPMALRRLAGAFSYWYSSMIFLAARMMSVMATPRGHRFTHWLHVEQNHQSSSSRSTSPYLDWQIILWGIRVRTMFQGQLAEHRPHCQQSLKASPPASLMRSIPSLNGVKYSKSLYPFHLPTAVGWLCAFILHRAPCAVYLVPCTLLFCCCDPLMVFPPKSIDLSKQ